MGIIADELGALVFVVNIFQLARLISRCWSALCFFTCWLDLQISE
jgi:hypothetical protein